MRELLDIQSQLLPDLLDVLKKRYTILHHIAVTGVVGRRTLAGSLDLSERIARGETEFLKSQGLLEVEAAGMKVSAAGKLLLEQMEPMIKDLLGLTGLEERIRQRFNLKQVVIVPGDSDSSPYVKKELGRAGASVLRKAIGKDEVIAVTGGSTMAQVAEHMASTTSMKGTVFVPARGGLGESLEFQANSIASTMAKKTGAKYRLLHVPDHLGEEAYQSLIQDPTISEIIGVIRQARIVIHGIGDAMVMARRRKIDNETIQSLKDEGAHAEAFGYYFNRRGQVIHKMPTAGMRLEDIAQKDLVIGVAGGKSKGEAIASVLLTGYVDVLVADESAAQETIKSIANLDGLPSSS